MRRALAVLVACFLVGCYGDEANEEDASEATTPNVLTSGDPEAVATAFADAVANGSPELCDFTPDLSDTKCDRNLQRLADSSDVRSCYGSVKVTEVDETDGITTVAFTCKSPSATGGAIDVEEQGGEYRVVESNIGAET